MSFDKIRQETEENLALVESKIKEATSLINLTVDETISKSDLTADEKKMLFGFVVIRMQEIIKAFNDGA